MPIRILNHQGSKCRAAPNIESIRHRAVAIGPKKSSDAIHEPPGDCTQHDPESGQYYAAKLSSDKCTFLLGGERAKRKLA
jgi:hypothetical protein